MALSSVEHLGVILRQVLNGYEAAEMLIIPNFKNRTLSLAVLGLQLT